MTTEEMADKIARNEERSKSNTHRLDKVEKRQDDLDEIVHSVHVLATKQNVVETDIKEIKTDVKSLMEKPAKRWDSVVEKALYAILGAFLAWILSGLPGV